MDLGSFFLILAVGIIILVLLARPFVEEDTQTELSSANQKMSEEGVRLSELLGERDRVLSAVEEIEADFQMGKIPADEYPQKRTELLYSGAEILKQIDELTIQDQTNELDDLEKLIKSRREARQLKNTGGYCPRCGNALQKNDRFCSGCGYEIKMD